MNAILSETAAAARVRRVEAWRLEVPLTSAYENALGSLSHFDAIIFKVSDEDGRQGWGEACPVAGYSPETPAEGWNFAVDVLPNLTKRFPSDLGQILDPCLARYPFVVSALHEALFDLAGGFHGAGPNPGPARVELLGTVNTLDADRAPDMARDLVARGYRTLKVKVGYDAQADAVRVSRIAEAVGSGARLRVDANQGYSVDQAVIFATSVPPAAIEVFEQPVGAEDWAGTERVAGASPLPIMLDESIYADADIERAARIAGIRALKLKMSKSGGPEALARQVAQCRRLGLDVVIGNGIATDLGCLHEGLLYARLGLTAAGEMNGFLKPKAGLLADPLRMEGAHLVLPAGRDAALIDDDRFAAVTRDRIVAH